jgi:hypothetical protein
MTSDTTRATTDTDLLILHAYWTGKRGSRAMPRRADIDPSEIPSLLPHVFLADVRDPLRFRFRLVGTAICARWGEDATWKFLDELDLDGEREKVLGQFAAAVRSHRPRFDVEEFVSERGRYLHYRRVLLPLSEDGENPNMLFGGQKAIGIDGYQVAIPKWI